MMLDEFSKEIWASTYKDHNDNTIEDTFRRVANAVAKAEKTSELQKEWGDKFFDLLSDFKVTAGGRIYSNAGTSWAGTTLLNCYVGPRPKYDIDSLDGIFKILKDQAFTLKSEGGWGMNFSFIRPRGSFIHGIGVESPGAVKYMELFDKASDIITCGSGKKTTKKEAKGRIRKGAMMSVLDCAHPDIEEFITAKQTPGRLTKFNISVNCWNEFMDKIVKIEELKSHNKDVPEDLDKWDLWFPDTTFEKYKEEWDGNFKKWKDNGYPIIVRKTISISYLWNLIMESTYNRAEPGVLFLDIANKTHCWNYGIDASISATNPCAEQTLPFSGVCNLASLNLTQFVDEKNNCFDLDKVKKYVKIAVRFLDNINDITNTPLKEYTDFVKTKRRIGLGVLGWASSLFMLRVKFGSKKAENLKEELMEIFTHTAVEYSIELAEEKGAFKDCENEKHAKAYFWEQINLPKNLINKISKVGIRNSALFSIQPTGNTSIFANIVSGGLEPIFLPQYIRTSILSTPPDNVLPTCPKYWQGEFNETETFKFAKEGDETILKATIDNVVYKIDKNRGLTKETLCEDYGVRYLKKKDKWDSKAEWAVTTTDLSTEEHIRDMMGWAKWIDASMSKTVNIPNDYPFKDFKSIYSDAYKSGILKGITTYRAGTMTAVLSEVKDNNQINETFAPKRKKDVDGEIHHFVVNKQKYYCAVGLLKDKPFEIFTGINSDSEGETLIPKFVTKGTISKESGGKYNFITPEATYHLFNGHNDDTADALTRMISCSLRHGSPISVVVDQLHKTKGPMTTFTKVLSRTLKKYIKDGQNSTENCPECDKKMVFSEGCKKCKNCGYAACG